jgi:ribosomal protein S18 acetylase RimI-like enzyme
LSFLAIVPLLYPDGRIWLERALHHVESQKAFCTLAFSRESLGGVILDIDKGHRKRKIATFFVSKKFSDSGIGSSLFSHCKSRWLKTGIDHLHLTVAHERRSTIEPFLFRRGFQLVAIQPERYGPNRHEFVYSASLS